MLYFLEKWFQKIIDGKENGFLDDFSEVGSSQKSLETELTDISPSEKIESAFKDSQGNSWKIKMKKSNLQGHFKGKIFIHF